LGRFGVVDIPTGISGFSGRSRAYVKVQDGCLLRCTFCIIPQVRPHVASRPPEHVLAEIERLVGAGFREIVLTGIHLGHYGVEWSRGRAKSDWTRLSHLLEAIVRLEGDFRVRLSSIEATEVTRELVAVMAAHHERICPHLHISMQSGSDRILARMRRRWGSRRYVDRCRLVCQALDRPALTTDIIVGFPGEIEDDFLATCQVAEEVGFSKIHIFPFSARRGTPAAEMADQVDPAVKAQRAGRLAALERDLRARYFERLVGRDVRVLVESPLPGHPGWLAGTACRYATVHVPAGELKAGQLVDLRVERSGGDFLQAMSIDGARSNATRSAVAHSASVPAC
jgi:threonylcarbamoyladenosine tRNA methylthiotransferase MtaB